MPDCVLYARVSSKDQQKEGFSIPAQLDLLRQYAAQRQCRIRSEFIDVETAKQAGRAAFNEMLAFIRKYPGRLAILVEKTDRLYRNLRDWVTLDELPVEIHLVKENVVLSEDSRSHEKFMHGIKVLMAKNYIDNLSEETKKGMTEKARQGIWPSFAPPGYHNVLGTDGKRTIEPDPVDGPVITRLFERFATGYVSIKMLARDFPTIRGRRFFPAQIHQALRKRIYTGDFDFDGKTYRGTYAPLVSRELWNRVQGILDDRSNNKGSKVRPGFTLTGLVRCGHCGCQMVGELKKGRYVYYHCTGSRGRCAEPYVREERLEAELGLSLAQLKIAPETLAWLRAKATEMDRSARQSTEETTRRLKADYDRLQARIETMYLDRLDGRISADFYDAKTAEWRREQRAIESQLLDVTSGELRSFGEVTGMLDVISHSAATFEEQAPVQKRNLVSMFVKQATWKGGELQIVLAEPYVALAHSNSVTRRKENEKPGSGQDIEIWLPDLNPPRTFSALETRPITSELRDAGLFRRLIHGRRSPREGASSVEEWLTPAHASARKSPVIERGRCFHAVALGNWDRWPQARFSS